LANIIGVVAQGGLPRRCCSGPNRTETTASFPETVLKNLPEQVKRLAVVFVVFFSAVLLVRAYVVPASLKDTRIHRRATVEREIARTPAYAGYTACRDCHEDVFASRKKGYHRNLSCETCHGPGQKHAADPEGAKPVVPRERSFCPVCHTYDSSRPTGFPQVNPSAHNPLKPCITCHNPHNPEPPEAPHECSACHGEIAGMKGLSSHALLDCTVCHTTPDGHKVTPRTVAATKPEDREFCGLCHGRGAENKDAPKVELGTHGEKYLCWQCHYPHLPEGMK